MKTPRGASWLKSDDDIEYHNPIRLRVVQLDVWSVDVPTIAELMPSWRWSLIEVDHREDATSIINVAWVCHGNDENDLRGILDRNNIEYEQITSGPSTLHSRCGCPWRFCTCTEDIAQSMMDAYVEEVTS